MMNIEVRLELVEVIRQYNLRVGTIESFKKMHILKTERGTKILKVWNDPKELEKAHFYKELLAKQGFRRIERFIHTRDGKPYVLYKGQGYSLSDLIEGLPPSIKRESDIRATGATLGEFHDSLSKIKTDKKFTRWSFHFENGLKSLSKLEGKLKNTNKSEFDQIIINDLKAYKEQINQSIQMAKSVEKNLVKNGIEPIWCHGNPKINSFKIDEYGEGWLIDFNYPIVDMVAYDMGKLISRLYIKNNYDSKIVLTFIDSYQNIKPLRPDDKLLLLTYIAYPHNIWKFLQIYLNGSIDTQLTNKESYEQLVEEQVNMGKLYQELFTYFKL